MTPLVWTLSLAILLAALAGAAPSRAATSARAAPASFPVDSVRAGMVGVGLSVFEGTRIDSFPVTILGVLKGQRPGATLILARAQGAFLERTGIIAGMSGSPVYINGRLLGAIAYTWSFSKDPVGGITPIGEMLDLFPSGSAPAPEAEERLGQLDTEPGFIPVDPAGAKPIATPLILSGFSPEAIAYLDPWLRERGFVAGPGGGSIPGISCDSLAPGSAVGVQLIRGDWSAAAIGTLTYRDGDRVLAFGHPFVGMGWVRFPLTAATIHTIFANQQISSKIGSPTTPCGTLLADRNVGVSGEIGKQPGMIPVAVSITGTGNRPKKYHFEVARSRFLAPNLVAMAVVNSVSEALYESGYATVRYDLTFMMNGGATRVRKGNAILTQSLVTGIGEEVGQTLQLLLSDHFRPSTLDSVRIEVGATAGLEAARISEVRVRPSTAAPGDSVEVEITLRRGGRAVESRRVRLQIPPQTPEGELTVRVCDGQETDRWERDRSPDHFKPETFDDLVRLIEEERRLDRMYVQLYRAKGGAMARGGEMSQAPASVLEVLGGAGKSGGTSMTKGVTLEEISIDVGGVTNGCETAKIDVVPNRER
jgi:SpoIVB peptidase S55